MASASTSDITAIGAITIICTTIGMGIIKITTKLVDNIIESRRTTSEECKMKCGLAKRVEALEDRLRDQ